MSWDSIIAGANELKFEIWGVFGGAIVELVKWYTHRQDVSDLIKGIKNKTIYWALTIVMMLTAAPLVFAHRSSGAQLTIILAINIGASAPLFWKLVGESIPNTANLPSPPNE